LGTSGWIEGPVTVAQPVLRLNAAAPAPTMPAALAEALTRKRRRPLGVADGPWPSSPMDSPPVLRGAPVQRTVIAMAVSKARAGGRRGSFDT